MNSFGSSPKLHAWASIDWTPHADLYANGASALMIVGSAVVVEACRYSRVWWQTLVGLVVASALFIANGLNAFEHLSNSADHRADHRKAAIIGAQNRSSERSEWSVKVDEARKKVGDRLVGDLEADLNRHILSNTQGWRATQECNPSKTTLSAPFCAEHARLKGLVEAATARDAAAAAIRKIDADSAGLETPTNADPFVASMTSLLGIVGISPSEEGKQGLRTLKSLSRTIGLELLATFGPMLWLVLIEGLMHPFDQVLQ